MLNVSPQGPFFSFQVSLMSHHFKIHVHKNNLNKIIARETSVSQFHLVSTSFHLSMFNIFSDIDGFTRNFSPGYIHFLSWGHLIQWPPIHATLAQILLVIQVLPPSRFHKLLMFTLVILSTSIGWLLWVSIPHRASAVFPCGLISGPVPIRPRPFQ